MAGTCPYIPARWYILMLPNNISYKKALFIFCTAIQLKIREAFSDKYVSMPFAEPSPRMKKIGNV